MASAGRVDEACAVATQAFDSAQHFSSDRVLHAVADFRSDLGSASSVTRDLDQRLDDLFRGKV